MLRIELSSEITRFLKLDQYLVTLKIRSRRRARRTENPKEPDLTADQMTSNIEPNMTTQSKRLKLDSKYIRGPSAYIFISISDMKSPRNTNSVTTATTRRFTCNYMTCVLVSVAKISSVALIMEEKTYKESQ